MKTFTTKQQFIDFFNERIDWDNETPKNITYIRDFKRVIEDEFIFNFDEQTLQNAFNIFNIEHFFTEIQAIEKIERKRLKALREENT